LRCLKESVAPLDKYTCFVGPNGAGKSTVLCALNIFFRNLDSAPTNLAALSAEDFHLQDTSKPVEITITFTDLSADAVADLSDYVRQGKLIVSAVAQFDPDTGRAEVKQYGQRLGMEKFKLFFEKYGDGALAGELKTLFEALEQNDPELAKAKIKKTKDGMYEGLKAFEAALPEKCIPIPSLDQFYGVSGGKDRLSKYVQWIYIPAVKNASDEQTGTRSSALGKLLARTVNAQTNFQKDLEGIAEAARTKYQQMLDANQKTLDGISHSLQEKLTQWSHPNATLRIVWENDSNKSVSIQPPLAAVLAGESGFEGKLARLGHGLQRSFLLALLQELAGIGDVSSPTLILGCEEPELYQHPPQSRHLAQVFEKLSGDNAQIIVTTHSPYFVSGEHFESVRMVRRTLVDDCACIRQFTYAALAKRFGEVFGKPIKNENATMAKLHQALQPSISEMFFTQRLVLVEGLEDVAYIHSWMLLSGRWDAFRSSGALIVPTNGKSELMRPTIIALGLDIPVMAIIDADGDKLTRTNKVTGAKEDSPELRTMHERENKAMLRLLGGDETNVFPTGVLWYDRLVVWPSDFADTVKREFIVALGPQGDERFKAAEEFARADAGFAGDLEKNTMYIGYLLERLFEQKVTSPSLDRICQQIISVFEHAKPAVEAVKVVAA
jgi:predicted ATP-dependent endonuclease of OLD family